MYYFYIFGNAPLHSKTSLDTGLNLLVQKKHMFWHEDLVSGQASACLGTIGVCITTFVSFKTCLPEQLSPLNMAAMSMSIILGLALETTPELLTYLQILGFIDTYVYHIQWSVGT